MPKRPNDKLLNLRYKRKIQKLEEKKKNASRRRRPWIIESDSDSESGVENNEDIETQIPMDTCPGDGNSGPATTEPDDDVMPPNNTLTPDDTQTKYSSSSNLVHRVNRRLKYHTYETVPELDEDIRLALGDPAEDTPVFGEKIPEYIAERWNPILRKGLSKDSKDKLLKEHNVPENCRLLKAPSLNPEIGSAVADVIRSRDKKIEVQQNQLGQGITAVSKAMALLINNDGNKHEVIKLLSEGCRILSDLHFIETQVRTKLIIPCLDKSFLNITQDEIRDDTLFGNKLSEKIKAAKSIEKQGLQIKRTVTVPAKLAPQHQNTSRYINRMGGVQFPHLNELAKSIWQWCEERNLWVFASYINTKDNIEADEESRRINPDTELELSTQAFQTIVNKLGKPDIDLFASRSNAKCDTYVSWRPDPEAFLVDAFTFSWLNYFFYCFPPFPLIIKCLQKNVLNFVSDWYPNYDLPLDKITKKLAVLIALCTAHRVQTLSIIKVKDIVIFKNQLIVKIFDLIKTSAPGREQPTLLLPFYRDKPSICPAKCLQDYLLITEHIRQSNQLDHLFLTHKRPHKKPTTQTISRWVKEILSMSGIDVGVFGAHSTRHSATSRALTTVVSLDCIRKTAGWTPTSQAFAKFYNRPIIVDNFAESVLTS